VWMSGKKRVYERSVELGSLNPRGKCVVWRKVWRRFSIFLLESHRTKVLNMFKFMETDNGAVRWMTS
jgi:hypothetical protein